MQSAIGIQMPKDGIIVEVPPEMIDALKKTGTTHQEMKEKIKELKSSFSEASKKLR